MQLIDLLKLGKLSLQSSTDIFTRSMPSLAPKARAPFFALCRRRLIHKRNYL
jgi:hypothetical protein